MTALITSLLIILLSLINFTHATTITVLNNCPYTVWAASLPGGGKRLNKGESWQLNPSPGTKGARIWGRTGCNFDGNGNGHCTTGDCGGKLQCQLSGADPQTLIEYTLAQSKNQNDIYDMSLIDGFNIPIGFRPTSNIGSVGGKCQAISCTADIIGQCPKDLKTNGGCNNPCTVYKKVKYCCTNQPGSCGPTPESEFFKKRCPKAYSYPKDDSSSTFSCPSGTNYKLTFCP